MTAPMRQNIAPTAKEIIKRIYFLNGVGCCWHVLLDDGNWDCIEYCRNRSKTNEDCNTAGACQELAGLDVTSSILSRAYSQAMREMREEQK